MLKTLSAAILAAATGVLPQDAAAQPKQERFDSSNQSAIVDVGTKIITEPYASSNPKSSYDPARSDRIIDCNTQSIFMRAITDRGGITISPYPHSENVSQEAKRICKKYGL